MGKENLSHLLAQLFEDLLVGAHQAALADGGGGLFFPQGQGSIAKPHLPAPGRDRAGTDQNHLSAALLKGANLLGQIVQHGQIQPFASGKHGAAHLDHHPFGPVEKPAAQRQVFVMFHRCGHHASLNGVAKNRSTALRRNFLVRT